MSKTAHARISEFKTRSRWFGRPVALTCALGLFGLFVMAAGCTQSSEERPAAETTTQAGTVSQPPLEITFQSQPDPPNTGENTFEATVRGRDGTAVTDVEVSADFYMAAMPAMKMPEMRNSVALKHEGDGRYRGTGNVMMAGSWEVTVSVKRDGKEIGSKKFNIGAK